MSPLLAGRRILVVDDEALLREVLREELEAAGAETLEAEGGDPALALLKTQPRIDAIICDMRMAKGSGDILLEKVRALSAVSPAMLMMSAYSIQSAEALYAKGAEAILAKPFSFPDLPTIVWKCLRPSEERMSLKRPDTIEREVRSGPGTAVRLGRGGCFVPGAEAANLCHGPVRFLLHLVQAAAGPDPGRITIEGEGEVRWTRARASGEFEAGAGIEFTYLDPESLKNLVALLGQSPPVAYIPNK